MRPTAAWPHAGPTAAVLAAAMAVCFCGSLALQFARESRYPRDAAAEAVLYVPSGRTLQTLALSFDAVLADVYWIRAVQHYGGTRLSTETTKRYHLLYPLLDITTTLDPQFSMAYRFGAIFLAEPFPGGPGRPDQAVALLEKGVRASPENWRYMQDIGFVYYWHLRDYGAAAQWFARGASKQGAPWWMKSLAAVTLAQGGDRRSSRALWTSLLQGAVSDGNEWLVRDATRRLQQLDALDAADQLRAVVRRFAAAGAPRPYSWEAIVGAGLLTAVPRDPAGTPFELGPWSGDVNVADESPLQPLPEEPPASR